MDSMLQLVIKKVPKESETLECKPRALARLGRIVKGNTFTIWDPGISWKHSIFAFLSEISRCAISNLDTSHGTLVNDVNIAPSVPLALSDRDSIKIGEKTSPPSRLGSPEKRPMVSDEASKNAGKGEGGEKAYEEGFFC